MEMMRALFTVLAIASAGCRDSEGTAAGQSGPQSRDTLTASSSDTPAKQTVLRARAYDRDDNLDSARILYEEAAKLAPEVRDWLFLRAAGVTRDKAVRDRYLERVELPVARDRRATTEAIALERSGEVEAAIRAYTAAGDRLSAVRLRMLRPNDTAAMLQARTALIALLAESSGQTAREGVALFDRIYERPTAAENLALARSAFRGGLAARAVSGYTRAFAGGMGTAQDRFNAGSMLARLNRDSEAAAQ